MLQRGSIFQPPRELTTKWSKPRHSYCTFLQVGSSPKKLWRHSTPGTQKTTLSYTGYLWTKSLSWDMLYVHKFIRHLFAEHHNINQQEKVIPTWTWIPSDISLYLRLQLFHCSLFLFGSTNLDGNSGILCWAVFRHGWCYQSWPVDRTWAYGCCCRAEVPSTDLIRWKPLPGRPPPLMTLGKKGRIHLMHWQQWQATVDLITME